MKPKPMRIPKRAIVGALCCAGFFSLLLLRFIAIAEPQTEIGYRLFKASYESSSDEKSVLRGFASNLLEYNGGYVPQSADRFLTSQLQNPTSDTEFDAIVDFYIQKAGGRDGLFIGKLPSSTKQRIVSHIIKNLDKYDISNATQSLKLVESLRRGQPLGKSHFITSRGYDHDYSKWWKQQGLPEAKLRFKKWWRDYPLWKQKEKHSPLEKSFVTLSEPP
jgi:hypothetical protein